MPSNNNIEYKCTGSKFRLIRMILFEDVNNFIKFIKQLRTEEFFLENENKKKKKMCWRHI